ncbi:M23 family metallopeptidase [Fulvivirga sp. M361]|uniref:M23 family metallopeptidase n=1 Tax=Fulvivirga sp. M361 TaxID=2594266 RepID=UPI00162A9396|nr:M23 family metallopeptidase [Fulvivirga sp. M361]
MRSSKVAYLLFLVCFNHVVLGQLSEDLDLAENYYLFPIKPGVRNTLAGTMGELRSTHFHSGIDIRTEGRIGLAVHAAATGYISRASISPTGYGNALYIMHPNGQTTVYAHLDKFKGPVADYVRQEQYRRKSPKINLYFRAGQFPVNKGDTIALSGNSGSSGGPHLHFDLRDKYQRPLNPLSYGFSEIQDHIPPVAQKIAVKTMDMNGRIEGQFGRKEYTLRRTGNNYVLDRPIHLSGLIGVELLAHDKLDNARFRCGINTIQMELDGERIFHQQIDKFAFSEQRNILAHMNYHVLSTTGNRFHKLYIDDGNKLKFYTTNNLKGKLKIVPGSKHELKISMKDTYGNNSYITLQLIGEERTDVTLKTAQNKIPLQVIDNTLMVSARVKDSSQLILYAPQPKIIDQAYSTDASQQVYLWDLRKGVPTSIEKGDFYKSLNFKDMIPSGSAYTFYSEKADIEFYKRSLFDTIYLKAGYRYDSTLQKEVFEIGDPTNPLRSNINVILKPTQNYAKPGKAGVFGISSSGELLGFAGGSWNNGKISFKTRNFGQYTIAMDTIPPMITPIAVNANSIKFKINDELSGLKKYECSVNNTWVLMHYDYKRSLIWSEKLDKSKPFTGEVKLKVTDNVNNVTEYSTKIE